MANRVFELQETKGSFQVKGIVNGVAKDKFYTSKKTKTNKDFRNVNFGCAYDNQKSIFMNLNGMPQQNVYFSKKNQSTGNTETKAVAWANRNKFNEDGFRMIGVNLGLQKTFDEKTKKTNGKFISGVGKYEGGLVSILDLTALDPETAKEMKEWSNSFKKTL